MGSLGGARGTSPEWIAFALMVSSSKVGISVIGCVVRCEFGAERELFQALCTGPRRVWMVWYGFLLGYLILYINMY